MVEAKNPLKRTRRLLSAEEKYYRLIEEEKGKKYHRHYGIFRVDSNGTLVGYVEQSFSMDWQVVSVRIWNKAEVAYQIEKVRIDYPQAFILRLSPLNSYGSNRRHNLWIDWKKLFNGETNFARRNASFGHFIDNIPFPRQ